MEKRLTLDVYSHGIRISGYSRETFAKLSHFLEGLKLKEPRKLPPNQGGYMVMELKKRFYGLREDNREAFIHRHQLNDLLMYFRDLGIPEEAFAINHIPVPSPVPATLTLPDGFVPRDYQITIVPALADKTPSRRLYLQTGRGKTACSLMAASLRGHRLVIMIPPKYFGLWLKALKETYLEIEERMVTVSGSAELQALQQRAVEGELTHDVYIISSVTYRTYLDSYEKFGERMEEIGYLIPPPRFHEALGIGTQISDEIHEDPGLVFRTDIFTNVAKQIYLSATPYTGNDYVTRMISVMLPAETDCPLPAYDAYINVVALLYNDGPLQRTDYLAPFKGTYNHARYETRLLKSKRRLERYYKMVKKVVDRLFVSDQQPGQKMLILCATVEFIKHLTKFLNMAFPNKRVGMHVAGSDYNKLLTNDITVSTIKSAGTGVDIPDLREVLLLQATDSKKDNIQILGRPRRLKSYPDVNPRLTYLVCQDIQKHVAYHRNKKSHFDGRVLSHRVFRL